MICVQYRRRESYRVQSVSFFNNRKEALNWIDRHKPFSQYGIYDLNNKQDLFNLGYNTDRDTFNLIRDRIKQP